MNRKLRAGGLLAVLSLAKLLLALHTPMDTTFWQHIENHLHVYDFGPFMVQQGVRRVPLRGFGGPSVSRSFNQLRCLVDL
jgi:hypothetical protein